MKAKLFAFLKVVLLVTGLGCAASLLWAGYHYFNSDPRYSVREITMLGLKHGTEEDVLSRIKLNTDSKTNIFAVDMDEVRTHVEQLPWVRYATVQRILPDRIIINIVEREPAGLARVGGEISAFDDEAAFLTPDDDTSSTFPILTGLSENDAEGNLKKIAMYKKANSELTGARLSEIIVNQYGEVSVVLNDESRVVNLGVDDFKKRWNNYLLLKAKIDLEYKDAVRVDLRFQNRVIVCMQADDCGGKVIWDGKKKSL